MLPTTSAKAGYKSSRGLRRAPHTSAKAGYKSNHGCHRVPRRRATNLITVATVSHERGQPAACPPYANIPRTASRQTADLSSTLRARPPRLARAVRGPRTAAAPRARRSSLFMTRPAGRRTRETIHAAACRKADPRRTPPRGTRRALTRAGVVPRRGVSRLFAWKGYSWHREAHG